MTKDQIELVNAILEKLGAIRQRPTAWADNLSGIQGIIYGVNMACKIFGLQTGYDDTYKAIALERGWEWLPAAAALPSMRERGLEDRAIIQELLTIEIEAWKRRYKLSWIKTLTSQS